MGDPEKRVPAEPEGEDRPDADDEPVEVDSAGVYFMSVEDFEARGPSQARPKPSAADPPEEPDR